MGLILDTSVLIASERRGRSVRELLQSILLAHGEAEVVISTVTVVELTHGIYRARTAQERDQRRLFTDEVFRDLMIHPVTLEVAQLAGQIEGEQAAAGNAIPFEDLLIGTTALHLRFEVATLNVRHFKRIPV